MFSGGFGAGGSESQSSWEQETNPWAAQDPFLRTGFGEASNLLNQGPYQGPYWIDPNQMQQAAWQGGYGAADPTGVMNRLYGFADMGMAGYGDSLNYYQQGLQGRRFDNAFGGPQYQQMIEDNYWTDVDQQSADQLRSNIELGLHRSDFGDRGAAAGSGFGGGSKYQIARGLAAGEADRNYKNSLAQLQQNSLGRATNVANQWAGQQMQNQAADWASRDAAARNLYMAGRGGMQDLTGAYDFGQQGYQNMAGWGDYRGGFDRERMAGQQAQWQGGWDPLRNFWDIVGASSWGSNSRGSSESSSQQWNADFGFNKTPVTYNS